MFHIPYEQPPPGDCCDSALWLPASIEITPEKTDSQLSLLQGGRLDDGDGGEVGGGEDHRILLQGVKQGLEPKGGSRGGENGRGGGEAVDPAGHGGTLGFWRQQSIIHHLVNMVFTWVSWCEDHHSVAHCCHKI